MRIFRTAILLAVLSGASASSLERRTYDSHDFFALHVDDSISPEEVARALGARHEGQIGQLPGHHKFSLPHEKTPEVEALLEELQETRRLRRRGGRGQNDLTFDHPRFRKRDDGLDGILWSQKLSLQKRLEKRVPPPLPPPAAAERLSFYSPGAHAGAADPVGLQMQEHIASLLGIEDPIFAEQWHLYNPVQLGHDLNVTGLWLEGITGKGVVSAIVDDGLDMYSRDLMPNYFAPGSWDYNDPGPEPRPRLSDDRHGTRCSGEIAAARNDACGVGVAYESKIAGIRILSKPIDDADEAAAINYEFQQNHIYSCSWGPPDNGETMDEPGILIKKAFVNGVQNGRSGKGSIFVFAAGNGANSEDNCNFDGYTNSIYSITVGAIDRAGNHPSYSESCSAQLVVAYSSGSGDAIHTTDVGSNKCFPGHSGTSAAGPLAVGVVALALSVRPDLTWRDMQYLFVETAVPVHEDDGSWQTTAIGKKFSHDWGYGKVDAYTLVKKAQEWSLVKPQAWYTSPWLRVQHPIPQGDQGLASSFEVTADMMKQANFERLEHVTVTMNIEHTRRGDLSVELRSPAGIVSHLSTTRRLDNAAAGYVDWTFMSVAHWGESGVGVWTVVVKDTIMNVYNGTFTDWRLNLWGEAIDAAAQPLHPMPDEHDDDHQIEDAIVATTTVEVGPTKTAPPTNPTDHVDRPVNAKPTATPGPEEPQTTSSTTTTDPAASTATGDSTAESTSPSTPTSDHLLPSIFPTFGASKRTQIWIYASFILIIVFCIGLGVYFQIQRQKRRRNNPHDDYEFEMIEDDEDMALNGGGGRGRASGRTTQRRGGELYNAFAGESDEELFSDGEDEEDEQDGNEPYKDRFPSDSVSSGESQERLGEKRRG